MIDVYFPHTHGRQSRIFLRNKGLKVCGQICVIIQIYFKVKSKELTTKKEYWYLRCFTILNLKHLSQYNIKRILKNRGTKDGGVAIDIEKLRFWPNLLPYLLTCNSISCMRPFVYFKYCPLILKFLPIVEKQMSVKRNLLFNIYGSCSWFRYKPST